MTPVAPFGSQVPPEQKPLPGMPSLLVLQASSRGDAHPATAVMPIVELSHETRVRPRQGAWEHGLVVPRRVLHVESHVVRTVHQSLGHAAAAARSAQSIEMGSHGVPRGAPRRCARGAARPARRPTGATARVSSCTRVERRSTTLAPSPIIPNAPGPHPGSRDGGVSSPSCPTCMRRCARRACRVGSPVARRSCGASPGGSRRGSLRCRAGSTLRSLRAGRHKGEEGQPDAGWEIGTSLPSWELSCRTFTGQAHQRQQEREGGGAGWICATPDSGGRGPRRVSPLPRRDRRPWLSAGAEVAYEQDCVARIGNGRTGAGGWAPR